MAYFVVDSSVVINEVRSLLVSVDDDKYSPALEVPSVVPSVVSLLVLEMPDVVVEID